MRRLGFMRWRHVAIFITTISGGLSYCDRWLRWVLSFLAPQYLLLLLPFLSCFTQGMPYFVLCSFGTNISPSSIFWIRLDEANSCWWVFLKLFDNVDNDLTFFSLCSSGNILRYIRSNGLTEPTVSLCNDRMKRMDCEKIWLSITNFRHTTDQDNSTPTRNLPWW